MLFDMISHISYFLNLLSRWNAHKRNVTRLRGSIWRRTEAGATRTCELGTDSEGKRRHWNPGWTCSWMQKCAIHDSLFPKHADCFHRPFSLVVASYWHAWGMF